MSYARSSKVFHVGVLNSNIAPTILANTCSITRKGPLARPSLGNVRFRRSSTAGRSGTHADTSRYPRIKSKDVVSAQTTIAKLRQDNLVLSALVKKASGETLTADESEVLTEMKKAYDLEQRLREKHDLGGGRYTAVHA